MLVLRRRSATPAAPAASHDALYTDANGAPTMEDPSGVLTSLETKTPGVYTDVAPGRGLTGIKRDGATDDLAAWNALLTAIPDKSVVLCTPGTSIVSGTISVPAGKHFVFISLSKRPDGSIIKTTSATADIFITNDWQTCFEGITFDSSATRTAGFAINYQTNQECWVRLCTFRNMWNGVAVNGTLISVSDCEFTNTRNFDVQFNGANVNSVVSNCTSDGTAGLRAASLEINQCGSLLVDDCDFIRAVNDVRFNPASGTGGCFSVYFSNTFFDSATGSAVKMTGAGNIMDVKFTSCWASGSVNGFEFASVPAGGAVPITSVDIEGCTVNSNTGAGILATNVSDWSVSDCKMAANGTAIDLTATATHYAKIHHNVIGPTRALGANTTGVNWRAGTYKGFELIGNTMTGNTTAFTRNGAVAAADAANYRVIDNPGVNPFSAVTTPAVPASATAIANNTGHNVTVYLKGGTLTVVTVGGVATGQAAAPAASNVLPLSLSPGQTIAITYTLAPTWVWVGS